MAALTGKVQGKKASGSSGPTLKEQAKKTYEENERLVNIKLK